VQAWVKIHAVLTVFERVAREVQIEEIACVKDIVELVLKLPHDKYTAFKFIGIEIIEDISFLLGDRNGSEEVPITETATFFEFAINGIRNAQTMESSSLCFRKICQNTQRFVHKFADQIIDQVLPT
jgi:hypothetical protein